MFWNEKVINVILRIRSTADLEIVNVYGLLYVDKVYFGFYYIVLCVIKDIFVFDFDYVMSVGLEEDLNGGYFKI